MKVGDLVRVKRANGTLSDQRYEVTQIGMHRCHIRQWPSTAPKGKVMANQPWHTSLLVVDNSGPRMLAAMFPIG